MAILWGHHALHGAVNLKEIDDLIKDKKYSIALEKALNVLNAGQAKLTPLEAGKLHYLIGVCYKHNNNMDMAANYLKKIEQQFPASEYVKKSYLELAEVYKEDHFQREAYLEKVFDNYPRAPEAVAAGIELGKGHLRLNNYQKAIPIFETLINLWKTGEKQPELYMLLALAYAGIKDYIEAIDFLRIAEKKIPDTIRNTPNYIFEAGRICYYNQNFTKSINYLNRLLNVYPDFREGEEAAIILAQAYEREQNPFMSSIYLIRVLSKNPTDRKKRYGLMMNLGRMLGQLKEDELRKIKKHYPLHSDPVKILTTVRENSPIFEQRRNATILLSGEFKKTRDFEKIIDNYYRFLKTKRDPLVEKFFRRNLDEYIDDLKRTKNYNDVFKFWVAVKSKKSMLSANNLLKLGDVLVEMQMYKNAEEIYLHMQRYTMFSKQWPMMRRALARLYFKMAGYDKFFTVMEKMKKDTPGEPEKSEFFYYSLKANKAKGNQDEFKLLLKQLPAREPKNIFQFMSLELKAENLEEEKKSSSALSIYQQLLLYPKLTDQQRLRMLLKIADFHYAAGEWESALNFYRRAEKFEENREWILFRKMKIYRATEQPEEAKKALDKLKEINPNSFWVEQAEKEKK